MHRGKQTLADKSILKEIGLRISKQRKILNLTQEQVAENMNVSTQMISNVELGKKAIRPENLINLCNVLEVTSDYILTGKKSPMDVRSITDKLLLLPDEDIKIIEDLIDYILQKNECLKTKSSK